MSIDGKIIAEKILTGLSQKVEGLTSRGVIPTLAVILVGDDPASLAYIKQKQKAATQIGAQVIFDHQPATIDTARLHALISKYNNDSNVHGLIIQRPMPFDVGDVSNVLNQVTPKKDVDGFLPNSPFDVPVALAVGEILKEVHGKQKIVSSNTKNEFIDWFRGKNIVVIGRGETAGAPILHYLKKHHCATSLIHSKTPNPEKIVNRADIIISCVGKERIIPKDAIKQGVILISVGIWKDSNGKLRGDYNEDEISGIASFYTPTPGGVGPVNVACLMKNLVEACMMTL